MVVGQCEFIIILILALFLFGPKKLPELARSLGHAVAEYHKAVREFKNETYKIEKELKAPQITPAKDGSEEKSTK